MTWLDLDSLGQNNHPSDWTFLTNQLPRFIDQAISSHRSTQAIATLFQEIALVSWPTSPSNCDCYF